MSIVLGALLGAVVLLVFAQGAWGQTPERALDRDPRGAPYAVGELIVTFKASTLAETQQALARGRGARVEKNLPELKARVFAFPAVKNERAREARQRALERIKQALERSPVVEAVDYNYLVKANYLPNDPIFRLRQWGHFKVGLPKAWDKTRGSSGVRIAVVDTGIAIGHPDIKGKVIAQRDFVSNDYVAQDDNGHGTHVAGIAAAVTNNAGGVAGTCPYCTLLAAKVLGADGAGYTDDMIQGLTWSANSGAKVINLSLGGPHTTAKQNAVNYAYNKGAVLVAAAGNEGTSSTRYNYPAAYPNVIAVVATDYYDRRRYTSNYGSWVDVAAPGVSILSSVPARSYGYKTGTSMASPYVAGLVGLLAAQGRTNAQIRYRIEATATDLGARGRDAYYGYGRINAAWAVQ